MLKTVYSNAYEILEAYLTAEITEDKKQSADPFERVRVISATSAINNRLRQHLAQVNGICSGVDFWTTQSWFHNYAGIGVGEPEEAQDFLWVIWSVLDDEFINRHERLRTFFSHRVTDKEKALARYELARKIASVFDKYVNYRFDWVAEWMGFSGVKPQTIYRGIDDRQLSSEKKALQAHPDFIWQKAIWEKLSQTAVWNGRETLRLYANPESLEIKFANEPETLHFFEPSGISPLMLPIIKLLSEHGHKVYVYLLNPCVEYWFDSYSDLDSEKSEALNFLRKNAASTRAMINRFWTFTPDGQENAGHEPEKLPDLTSAPLQKLNIWTQAQTERLDLVQDSELLLHTAQKALLQNSAQGLPEKISPSDPSVRIIKAPTLTREVQNAINMIQAFFADRSLALKPEEVLITTPEIDKTAPVFEACMRALPAQYRMDYQIFGQTAADADMNARSLVDLGKLLMNGITLPALNAWLELPAVARALDLKLDDLNVLHDWLLAAGFRSGINAEHLKATHPDFSQAALSEAGEGTLERAIERLSWGYVFKEGTLTCTDDILPVQHGSDPFAGLADNQSLFIKLCRLADKLKEAFSSMKALGDEALPADLSLWTHNLLESFFGNNTDKLALMSVRNDLRVQELALTTVPEPITMPLCVYWRALEDRISEPSDKNPAIGRLTLAPMSTFRGLPYKVIIIIGLGEESGFPGNQRFEEFDLMGTDALKRQNDRDSRSDNRNVFLDLFLAARNRFVCSYCVGSDKKAPLNASPVVVDLLDFLTQNAAPEDNETKLEAKKRMADTITTEITLTDTAADNFRLSPTRYWKSFMGETLDALKKARETNYQGLEPQMLTGPLDEKLFSSTLYLEDVLAFYKDPAVWLQKRLDFRQYENGLQDRVPLFGSKDGLELSLLRRELMQALADGHCTQAILNKIALDPTKGNQETRILQYEEEVEKANEIQAVRAEILSCGKSDMQTISLPLENLYPFKTLLAENIQTITFHLEDEQREKDPMAWQSSTENDTPYLLELAYSKSGSVTAQAKAAILCAMGVPVNLLLLNMNEKPVLSIFKAIEKPIARYFLFSLIELMVKTIQKACVITSKYDNAVEAAMWRGRDYETIKGYSTAFLDNALKAITPDAVFPKEDKGKRTKAMELLTENFENLMLGGAQQ